MRLVYLFVCKLSDTASPTEAVGSKCRNNRFKCAPDGKNLYIPRMWRHPSSLMATTKHSNAYVLFFFYLSLSGTGRKALRIAQLVSTSATRSVLARASRVAVVRTVHSEQTVTDRQRRSADVAKQPNDRTQTHRDGTRRQFARITKHITGVARRCISGKRHVLRNEALQQNGDNGKSLYFIIRAYARDTSFFG